MDIAYLLWLQQLREAAGPALKWFFLVVTSIPTGVVSILIIAGIYWCLDKRGGVIVFLSLTGGNFINQVIKVTACVYRPWVRSGLVHPAQEAVPSATGYSFPSGHTSTTTSVYGGIGWRYRKRGTWGRVVFVACVVLILLVGFSRNFLGVHTLQDVIVGIAVGVLALFLAFRLDAWLGDDPLSANKDLKMLAVILATCVAAGIYVTLKPYPMDYLDGQLIVDPETMRLGAYNSIGMFAAFAVGYVLEMRFVGFSTTRGKGEKVFRLVTGLLIMVIVYTAIRATSAVLPPAAYNLIHGFMLVFGGTFLSPAFFEPVGRRIFKRGRAPELG